MGRVFACSDLHGFKSLYDQINDFLEPDDIVYFLGDAADRGPHGWEIMKSMIFNHQWKWIMGNHDEMLVERILGEERDYHSASLHDHNGGRVTWAAIEKDLSTPEGEMQVRTIAERMAKLPKWDKYYSPNNKVFFMSHSGDSDINDEYELVWNRDHYVSKVRNDEDFDIVLHGHTPAPYMIDDIKDLNRFISFGSPGKEIELAKWDWDDPHAYWYHDNTKCNLDMLTICTGKTALLNLDTLEEHIFTVEGDEEDSVQKGVF